ncbi:hypothetical protein Mame_01510 [Martelella mediterranea DSM 17316]|uniref:Uncharacterized protein n=1 Tax=Martelella mediterranea DSM 17316 TaxID=1122214 RepID=A0A1U9YZI7_9HYPH|nr:hypothetical protein Mame_01510 [Martelella mediterranea DSM 17316]
MQEIGGALRMGGGAEDGALVFFQHFEPALNIGCMIGAWLWGQFQISTKKRRAKFGNQFFTGISACQR